jgi:hypothetical protein
MTVTGTLTPLGHQILDHWRRHRPKMVEKSDEEDHPFIVRSGDA